VKRILIADDHTVVRTGLSVLIKAEYSNVQIDECSDGICAWEKIQSTPYDLFVMDINMPATDSVNLLKNIFSVHPQAKVLILSMSSEEIYAKKYLQLGALGFINKESDSTEIRRAITTVMSNRKYVSPKLEEIITRQAIEGPPAKSVFEKLSARELEVMTHLVEGRNISEIAGLLSVHISTASTHKANIMEKLKVKNVIELTTLVKRFNIA
jgi:two-component system, NarL family, invasion response regulator UvrY